MIVHDKPRVCLIVDNPLRDLEGLLLLGRQLSLKGAEVALVPMYEQGFDVLAFRPDLVVVNYTRPNNADLIKSYKRAGILVGVLDTEGIGGKNPDHFAKMVKTVGCTDVVDLYCVWGNAQYAAFIRNDTVPASRLHATGCPRYDFCAEPWRQALPQPPVAPGYVLINTNFPVVNPRFSSNSSHEQGAMVQAGFSQEFARQFVSDAEKAHREVIAVSISLAKRFTDVQFVLRPHPFESIDAYSALFEFPNVHVRQEGTSLEWINAARLLVHQNCSTAIEATMMGIEPLSMEWFNTPTLRLDAATQVSRTAASENDLVVLVQQALDGNLPPVAPSIEEFRRQIIGDLFTAVDGASSDRATSAILDTIAAARRQRSAHAAFPRSSIRGILAETVRKTLGYKASVALRRAYASPESERRRLGKAFTRDGVNSVLKRIDAVSTDKKSFVTDQVIGQCRRRARMSSGTSLQFAETV